MPPHVHGKGHRPPLAASVPLLLPRSAQLCELSSALEHGRLDGLAGPSQHSLGATLLMSWARGEGHGETVKNPANSCILTAQLHKYLTSFLTE